MNLELHWFLKEGSFGLFDDKDMKFTMSVLGTNGVNSRCNEASKISKPNSFPIVISQELENFNKQIIADHGGDESYRYKLLISDDIMNGITRCTTKDKTNMCKVEVMDDVNVDSYWK